MVAFGAGQATRSRRGSRRKPAGGWPRGQPGPGSGPGMEGVGGSRCQRGRRGSALCLARQARERDLSSEMSAPGLRQVSPLSCDSVSPSFDGAQSEAFLSGGRWENPRGRSAENGGVPSGLGAPHCMVTVTVTLTSPWRLHWLPLCQSRPRTNRTPPLPLTPRTRPPGETELWVWRMSPCPGAGVSARVPCSPWCSQGAAGTGRDLRSTGPGTRGYFNSGPEIQGSQVSGGPRGSDVSEVNTSAVVKGAQ